MTRPAVLVAVLGTGTEVGKTWLAARLIEELAGAGLSVAARKPLQSFDPGAGDPTDAEVLAEASGEHPSTVTLRSRSLPLPMAPPMAAAALGVTVPTNRELIEAIQWPHTAVSVGFVETIGGARSPLSADGDSADLVNELEPDLVIIVADAELGTIDRTRGAVSAVNPDLEVIVFLNRYDDTHSLHTANRSWLCECDGFVVMTAPSDLANWLRANHG